MTTRHGLGHKNPTVMKHDKTMWTATAALAALCLFGAAAPEPISLIVQGATLFALLPAYAYMAASRERK